MECMLLASVDFWGKEKQTESYSKSWGFALTLTALSLWQQQESIIPINSLAVSW